MDNYQLQDTPAGVPESVCRLSDFASIPMVDGNSDYEKYKEWLAAGNTPLPVNSLP